MPENLPLKIVRTDREIECPHLDGTLRSTGAELVLLPDSVSEGTLIREVKDADLLLMCYTPITSDVIHNARKLKAIIKYGVGIDAIDLEAAKACEIPVANVPEYAAETVAEGAFAMLIALVKKLLPISDAVQSFGWVWPTSTWMGNDISEKTLGLVGVGRIGRSMARMAGTGFHANVLGFDPHVSEAEMLQFGVVKCNNLCEMLGRCDFVSIHCVLNEETSGLIGPREFNSMKPAAILINTARGAIVCEQSLVQSLRDKKLAGAGLDVFQHEPLSKDNHPLQELYGMKNVILMPHLTFFTAESMNRLETETLERCLEVITGKPVLVKSLDPRLAGQPSGVTYV